MQARRDLLRRRRIFQTALLGAQAQSAAEACGKADMAGVGAVSRLLRGRRLALRGPVSRCHGVAGTRSVPNPAELGWVWEGAVGRSRQLSGEGHDPEVAGPVFSLAKFSKVKGRV